MIFRNINGETFTIDEVLQKFYLTVEQESWRDYKLIVGSDSQKTENKLVYITVIVLYTVGRGGTFFYSKNIKYVKHDLDLSVKILQETEYTVDILKKIENSILISKVGKDNLSAHVDASKTGDSKKIVDACVGWIKSLGFDCKFKPHAWAASTVADRLTK